MISSLTQKSLIDLSSNLNLHSLRLILADFEDLFTLIEYKPNLKYLNVQIQISFRLRRLKNKINIHLTRFMCTNAEFNQSIQ